MAGKKPLQDATPPSISSESDGAAARPASAPATRVLPQRQGLHSPRVSPATQPSDSTRPSTAIGQQRRGPEKQPVLLPDAASGQIREEAPLQHTAELQLSSPRGAKLKGGACEAPGSASSRPTSGSKRLTRSDAEEAKAAADRQAEEDQELAVEALLEDAAAIRRLRDSLARPMPTAPEPKRAKTHWDHLLEEMTWLAKEFQKERKWKLNMAKKYVRAVARSNLDLESRKNVRQKEAELAVRRKAAFIGKEVMQFWKKAERVMVYKRQSQLDARKKEAMDKHLSFLVDQTQKYSSLLAQRLGGEEVLALPAPQSTPLPAGSQPSLEPNKPQTSVKAEEIEALDATAIQADDDLRELDDAAGSSGTVKVEPIQGSQDGEGLADSRGEDDIDVSEAAEGDSPRPGRSRGRVHGGLAALEQDQQAAEDDADDFKAGSASEEADDEATLEEEEAMARDAGEDSGNEGELSALADEADMPLEQLMALYGYVPGSDEPEDRAGLPEGQSSAAGGQPGKQSAAVVKPPEEPMCAAEPMDVDSDDGDAADPEPAENKPDRDLADLMDKEEGHDGGMDADYASAASEADDEATLEEEDALAAQDGTDQKEQDDAEVAALADEADMPLEQLLAMYGMIVDENTHQGPDSAAAGGAQDPSESGRGRSRKRRKLAPGLTETDADGSNAKKAEERAADKAASEQAAGVSSMASVVPSTPGVAAPALVPEGAAKAGAAEAGTPAAEEDHDQALAELEKVTDGKAKLEGVARLAEQAQPKGSTLDSAGVHTPVPFLLKGSLREYQHVGLDWLVTIYTRRLNGILADEMGLGKTIMTIALLAHLACEKGVWGPHLIVVPTSVMLNWEVECKKWCPAFKLLTYYGSAKERKAKRQGWSKPNAFHICITSYTLVLQDAKMFRRKKWKYLILDEAHMIKNWKSQRWQTLLNFNSQRRLLITGTPLQNDLMELWSLMHFLMPQVFASHAQFKDWFSNPLTGMVEGQEAVNKALVERLHSVLRPFLLRRLKRDVEKQLPGKHEHIIKCRLSKRQRTLYEDYMAASDVRNTLSSGNFLGIINVLMQLRKVCNHPDLFEGRSIISAFDMLPSISIQEPSSVLNMPQQEPSSSICLDGMVTSALHSMSAWEAAEVKALETPGQLIQEIPPVSYLAKTDKPLAACMPFAPSAAAQALVQQSAAQLQARRQAAAAGRRRLMAQSNARRCSMAPVYGEDLLRAVHVDLPVHHVNIIRDRRGSYLEFSQTLADAVRTAAERTEEVDDSLKTFMFVIPKARAATPEIWCSRPDTSALAEQQAMQASLQQEWFQRSAPLRTAIVRQQVFFPDRRLIQFDCGKLQELAVLLRKLKSGGHKALIFTQMARMLDVLEVFLNLHGYTYVRLDGTTKPEQRQILMQRYNTNPKLFIFILSTRSGGVGMNLTGADTVIFYDSDWNPAMDAQAQDRCHRIGQTREVHIYRLVSESTIEENILHKSDQKRQLDHLAIQSGGFNTDFLQKFNPRELLGIQAAASAGAPTAAGALSAEEMQAAMQSVEDETDQAAAQALQLETEAELAEFNADPAPKPLDPEGDEDDNDAEDTRDPEASGALEKPSLSAPVSQPSTEVPPVKAEEEEEADTMDDVAALAGNGKSQDALATLESALRPVERYAVHFLEEQAAITTEVELATAAVEAELDAQEWNMQEIERIQEEQEAEIEEDVEATRVLDWDKSAADAAYRAKVEEAEARQRLILEQRAQEEAAWLEQQEALLAMQAAMPVQPIYTRMPPKKLRTPELDDAESQQYSPYPRFSRKRARTARGRMVVRPRWPGEDTTPSASHDDSDAYSSPDEASPWTGSRAKRHHSMLSPQGLRQRSRLADNSPGGTLIKQEASDSYTPGHLGANGAADIPRPYNASRQYPQIGQLRAPAHVWLPWDVLEDVVLATMVEDCQATQLGSTPKSIPASLWQLASDALSAGAATLSTTAAAAAGQPMKMRSTQHCRDRYELLLAALHDSRAQLPASAPKAAGPPAAPAHTAPAATSLAGAAAGSFPPVTPPSSLASAEAATADRACAGLAGLVPPSQIPLAQQQGPVSAAGAYPGTGLQSPTPLQAVAAAASGHPSAGQHLARGSTTQQSAAPAPSSSAQFAQQQQAPAPPHFGIAPQHGCAGSRQGSMPASLSLGSAHKHDMQPGNGAAWSLSSELQTLREHLAWLASSNVVCGIEGISAVTAAAMGGQTPTEGSAAGQLSEVLAELQSLPRNGQLRALSAVGPKPLHRSCLGVPVQAQPLQVAQADAAAVRSAVVMAAGAPSRGVIRHLDAVVSAVRSGGVQAGNAALRQLLQLPRHPPIAAAPAPQQAQQLRPPLQPQQMGPAHQQPLPGSAPGPHSALRPVRGPMPGPPYSMAGQGMRPGQPGQQFGQRPHAQGFPQQTGRPGMPGTSLPLPMRPGAFQQQYQASQAPGQAQGPHMLRPQLSQPPGSMSAGRPGFPGQQALPAYLRPALMQQMQQVQQVVGQMQTSAGGTQGGQQPGVNLIPGLQALLAQQASSAPLQYAGQSTSSQSQQHNLALLHSLLSQAHSAAIPAAAGVGTPGIFSAGQLGQHQLPTLGTRPPGQLQWSASTAPQFGQLQMPTHGMSQPAQHGRPSPPMNSSGGVPVHMQPGLSAAPRPSMSAAQHAAPTQAPGPQNPLRGQQPGEASALAARTAPQAQGSEQGRPD